MRNPPRRGIVQDSAAAVPTPERRNQGVVERLDRPIADESGRPARPYRAVDTLAAMERRGSITAGMRQAGEDFRARFAVAQLDPLRVPDWSRPRHRGSIRFDDGDQPGLRIEAARNAVWKAIQAVGGVGSPAGSCLWHVVMFAPTSPLLWALCADTADYSEWKTGRRATGLVFSATGFSQMLWWAAGGSLFLWLLGYIGFKSNVVQPLHVQTSIRYMMSFYPAIAGFLSAALVLLYKLDDATMVQIERDLKPRRLLLSSAFQVQQSALGRHRENT
jgi:hypothetical protein